MNKKYFYGSLILIIGIVFVWQFAANAQTWSGPKSNCSDPSVTDCNVDGVVWNRSDASIGTVPAQPGNYKISGMAEIGGDLILLNDAKSITVNQPGKATFNIGNWKQGDSYLETNIHGNLNLVTPYAGTTPTLTAPQICLGPGAGDCRTAWPVAAGGTGDVTDVLFTAPITVTTPGGPQPRVALTTCAANQIYKMSGGVWTCSADADTNSGGTISNLSSSNNSISITNVAGPNTVLTANNVYFDDRYVNVSGDTMAGNFSSPFGNMFGLSAGNWLLNVQPAANTIFTSGLISHTGSIESSGNITVTGAGQVKASTLCIGNDCRAAWPSTGMDQATADSRYVNKGGDTMSGTLIVNNTTSDDFGIKGYGGPTSVGVFGSSKNVGGMFTNSNTNYNTTLGTSQYALSASGPTYFAGGNVTVVNSLCLGGECKPAWPVAGTGDITDVIAGTGLT
ncbi:MAG: hypothetical protein WCT54_00155, partial [Patescibacteria group bacterium]